MLLISAAVSMKSYCLSAAILLESFSYPFREIEPLSRRPRLPVCQVLFTRAYFQPWHRGYTLLFVGTFVNQPQVPWNVFVGTGKTGVERCGV